VAKLFIWPQGYPELKEEVSVKETETRFGADLSHFSSDQYEYQLYYFYRDPETDDIEEKAAYLANGRFQLIAPSHQDSHNIVLQVKENQLLLAGKTQDEQGNEIRGLQLYKDGAPVGKVSLTPIIGPAGHYQTFIDDYDNGSYVAKPIYQLNPMEAQIGDIEPFTRRTKLYLVRESNGALYLNFESLPPGVEKLVIRWEMDRRRAQ
jgi:hypothetical protein